MRYTIYLNSKHNWYSKLKQYSISNEWTVSHAISHIIEEYFNGTVNLVDMAMAEMSTGMGRVTDEKLIAIKSIRKPYKPKKQKPIVKVDYETFEAEIEAKLIPINNDVENCDRRTIDSTGKPSCYFFDQGKAYYPYCIKDCWTSDLWGKRVRK